MITKLLSNFTECKYIHLIRLNKSNRLSILYFHSLNNMIIFHLKIFILCNIYPLLEKILLLKLIKKLLKLTTKDICFFIEKFVI